MGTMAAISCVRFEDHPPLTHRLVVGLRPLHLVEFGQDLVAWHVVGSSFAHTSNASPAAR